MTWKHLHSPVKKKFKTCSLQGKWWLLVFWDVHEVLLFDFTPPGSTMNAAAYQETLKRLKEAIRRKRPGLLTKGLPQPRIPWALGAGKFFHIHRILQIWHSRTSVYSERRKSTSEVGVSTPMKIFKIKSRNRYVPRTPFFYERLNKLINRNDKRLNRPDQYGSSYVTKMDQKIN
jgi:hypothetical protein